MQHLLSGKDRILRSFHCSFKIKEFIAFGKCSATLSCSMTCRQMRFWMQLAVSKHPPQLCRSTCFLCWRGELRSKRAGKKFVEECSESNFAGLPHHVVCHVRALLCGTETGTIGPCCRGCPIQLLRLCCSGGYSTSHMQRPWQSGKLGHVPFNLSITT